MQCSPSYNTVGKPTVFYKQSTKINIWFSPPTQRTSQLRLSKTKNRLNLPFNLTARPSVRKCKCAETSTPDEGLQSWVLASELWQWVCICVGEEDVRLGGLAADQRQTKSKRAQRNKTDNTWNIRVTTLPPICPLTYKENKNIYKFHICTWADEENGENRIVAYRV